MSKKFFIFLAVILFTIFSFTICFATDGSGLGTAANNVRNFVDSAEDTVENAAMGVSNTSKNITADVEKGMNRTTDANRNYTATRTSTTGTVMGMSSTAWTWLIIGVAAIAIIAVVWYYSMQFTNNNNNHHNND